MKFLQKVRYDVGPKSCLHNLKTKRHALAALYPRGKDLRYPLDRTLGGPHSRSGRRG
jgi:hypothetical protein